MRGTFSESKNERKIERRSESLERESECKVLIIDRGRNQIFERTKAMREYVQNLKNFKNNVAMLMIAKDQGTIENNALVLLHFTSTPSNRKISTQLLRTDTQTVFKVYAKVRKYAQFENFAFLCHKN